MVIDSTSNSAGEMCPIASPLAPGEELLWLGRPDPGLFRSEAWAAFVFGLFPLAAGCGTIALVSMSLLHGDRSWYLAVPHWSGCYFC